MFSDGETTHEPAIEIDYRVEAGNWEQAVARDGNALAKVMDQTFAAIMDHLSSRQARAVLCGSEVSVLFSDDAHIRVMNRDYRRQDKATNVLSFPQKPADAPFFGPYLGDIALAYETVYREAENDNKSFLHHLQHLLVHGFLHLVGYDHETDKEADEMEALERDILHDLHIADPYGDIVAL